MHLTMPKSVRNGKEKAEAQMVNGGKQGIVVRGTEEHKLLHVLS